MYLVIFSPHGTNYITECTITGYFNLLVKLMTLNKFQFMSVIYQAYGVINFCGNVLKV